MFSKSLKYSLVAVLAMVASMYSMNANAGHYYWEDVEVCENVPVYGYYDYRAPRHHPRYSHRDYRGRSDTRVDIRYYNGRWGVGVSNYPRYDRGYRYGRQYPAYRYECRWERRRLYRPDY